MAGDGDNVGTFTSERVFLKEAHGNYEDDFSAWFSKVLYNYTKEENRLVYSLENFLGFKYV